MELIAVALFSLLYFNLGKRLGKNPIAWAFVGMGVIITFQLLGLLLVMFPNLAPGTNLLIWTMVHISSWIIAIIIAFIIAHQNKLNLLNFKTKSV